MRKILCAVAFISIISVVLLMNGCTDNVTYYHDGYITPSYVPTGYVYIGNGYYRNPSGVTVVLDNRGQIYKGSPSKFYDQSRVTNNSSKTINNTVNNYGSKPTVSEGSRRNSFQSSTRPSNSSYSRPTTPSYSSPSYSRPSNSSFGSSSSFSGSRSYSSPSSSSFGSSRR